MCQVLKKDRLRAQLQSYLQEYPDESYESNFNSSALDSSGDVTQSSVQSTEYPRNDECEAEDPEDVYEEDKSDEGDLCGQEEEADQVRVEDVANGNESLKKSTDEWQAETERNFKR